jgi:hypothetical protein
MHGGRARWKSENATVNTWKNPGDNCAHTAGHGEKNLAVVCATLMLLAFLVEQTQQVCGAFCQAVGAPRGSNRLRWERRRALVYDDALLSLRPLLEALVSGVKTARPTLAIDSSYCPVLGARLPATSLPCHQGQATPA